MALSDLAVYSEYAYSTMTEVLQQQVDLFNQASNGAILLRSAAHQGDFSDIAFFQKVDGLIRRRNAYADTPIAQKSLKQIVDTMVKVATGTPEMRMDKGQFNWIQMNPEVAGAALGQQLAIDALADMLDIGLGATRAALLQDDEVVLDISGETPPADLVTLATLARATGKFGDASSRIVAWVMHSKPMFDMYANSLANTERLFTYGNVIVSRDPFGKLLIMTDAPALVDTTTTPAKPVYSSLGLTQGAIMLDQNNDYWANEENKNGFENIQTTFQAEWSYELGIKGYSWDKANGGKSPTNAALLTSTNWDRYSTSHKDLAGVLLESH
ncbi:major capsid protein [Erwinia phage AH03]|uniref:Major capsid protein n=1 Tax=Erwinia phage AH03 TaxID=2869568 RepID=A0AAE7X0K0_9CAUD|nr:major capsid protein [Erwinia phage AH03]